MFLLFVSKLFISLCGDVIREHLSSRLTTHYTKANWLTNAASRSPNDGHQPWECGLNLEILIVLAFIYLWKHEQSTATTTWTELMGTSFFSLKSHSVSAHSILSGLRAALLSPSSRMNCLILKWTISTGINLELLLAARALCALPDWSK